MQDRHISRGIAELRGTQLAVPTALLEGFIQVDMEELLGKSLEAIGSLLGMPGARPQDLGGKHGVEAFGRRPRQAGLYQELHVEFDVVADKPAIAGHERGQHPERAVEHGDDHDLLWGAELYESRLMHARV